MSTELERVASAFERIATVLEKWYESLYPPKHEPRDVTLTNIPSDLELIKANQGASEETTEDWLTDVGPREREFIEKGAATIELRQSRFDKKASRSRSPKSST